MKQYKWIKYAQQNNKNIIFSGDWELPPEIIKILDIEHNSIYHEESVLRHTEEVVKTIISINYENIFGPIIPRNLNKQKVLSDIRNILITASVLHDIGKQNKASNFICDRCEAHTVDMECKNCGNKDPNKFKRKIKYICKNCEKMGKFSHSNKPICQICGNAARNNEEILELFRIIPNQQFIDHETEGWRIAGQFMQNVPKEYQFIIRLLIKNHMQFGQLMINGEQAIKDRCLAIEKLLNKIKINYNWITPEIFFKMSAILAIADHTSRQQRMTTPIIQINQLLNMFNITNLDIANSYTLDDIPREKLIEIIPELIQKFYTKYKEIINGPVVKINDKKDSESLLFDAFDPDVFKKITLINQILQEHQCNFEVNRNTTKEELIDILITENKEGIAKYIFEIIDSEGV